MLKLSQLSGDKFFDALYAISPLFPVLEEIDVGKLTDKQKSAEQVGISLFGNVIAKLIPTITSKENRHCVWELISILDEKPISEVEKYPPPKLIFKIRKIFADGELTSFLSYVDESDSQE